METCWKSSAAQTRPAPDVCVYEAVVGVSVSKIESCELDFSLCLMEQGPGAHLILGSSRPRCIDPHIIIDGAISK